MHDLNKDVKEQQLKVLQETIRNLQTQLLDKSTKERENLAKINDLEQRLKQANVKELLLKTKIVASKTNSSQSTHESETDESDQDVVCLEDDDEIATIKSPSKEKVNHESTVSTTSSNKPECVSASTTSTIDSQQAKYPIESTEAKLISLVSTFLLIHPSGANLIDINSYIKRYAIDLQSKYLELFLNRYKDLFHSIILNDQHLWKLNAFVCVTENEIRSSETCETDKTTKPNENSEHIVQQSTE